MSLRSFYLQLIEQGPSNIPGWLVFAGLWPFSLLYRFVMWLRTKAYALGVRSIYHASIPVISVGNLTVGGTGKTPVVDTLIKYLVSQGRQVAVVSRGYRGSFQGDCCRVLPGIEGQPTSAETGDEPFLLASRNPEAKVYVARKRRHGVVAAETDRADCVILDDAFQHLSVFRDMDIVLLDARKPFGNGALIPAGCLREPRTALQRADQVVLTHSENSSHQVIAGVDVVRCRHRFSDSLVDLAGKQYTWEQISGCDCLAFAGIAHPDDFFLQLREKGCVLKEALSFADHQEYDSDLVETINKASKDVDFLLTTEKDAVKLRDAAFSRPCLAVPLELEFENFDSLSRRLDVALGGHDE